MTPHEEHHPRRPNPNDVDKRPTAPFLLAVVAIVLIEPPALTQSANQWSAGELFWIIRHGIKMSGMPAWPDHSDDDI
jgi:hypothetical protein